MNITDLHTEENLDLEVPEKSKDYIRSLERGLAVIRAFSSGSRSLTLTEVANATGISRASARRFLLTLLELGYVGSDGRSFYLRPRVLELGQAYLRSESVSVIAQSHLEILTKELGESCSASVLDDADIIYTARSAANRIMSINLAVGQRLPAYATSMGRVLLAFSPETVISDYLQQYERTQFTDQTVTAEKALLSILRETAKQGWAMIDQELEEGVRSIAVPVRDPAGKVLIAINVSVHATRVSTEVLKSEFLPKLSNAAREIEADLINRP